MAGVLPLSQALTATLEIAQRCTPALELGKPLSPFSQEGKEAEQLLTELTGLGLESYGKITWYAGTD